MPLYQTPYLEYKACFKEFVANEVVSHANSFDTAQAIPRDFFHILAKHGILGACVPKKYGGQGIDYIALGIMHEELAAGLCSLENAVTVYGMVCKPIVRFGNEAQKKTWLPKIVRGEIIVSLALTEPNIGSDLKNVQANAEEVSDSYLLTGKKRYITLGQIADLFLVLAKCDEKHLTLLVERDTPGLTVSPIRDLLGLRSNMLAEISFDRCQVPKQNLLGSSGQGFSQVVQIALDEGRYTTACGCVGLGQACLNTVLQYVETREQYGALIKEHQLIQKMITEIIVNVKAAREVCYHAGVLRENGDFNYLSETLIAKYIASKMTVLASNHALQIFSAAGFTKNHSIERYYRDAKVMEIIEGTSQMYEINIPKYYVGSEF